MWCHLLLAVPLVIAALFLFLPWSTALPLAGALGLGTLVIVYLGVSALRRAVATGREALIGKSGEAASDLSPEGLVRVRGELWVAEATEPIGRGKPIQILEVQGAKLKVRPWAPRA
jgi:membrane-bound serine protease (ClpP class)